MPQTCRSVVRYRISLGFLLAALTAGPTFAEEFKAQAERLCHAYIDHPQDFGKIPTMACAVRLGHAEQLQELQCFKHEVEGSSAPTTFASFASGGSCGSSSIAEVDDQNRVTLSRIRNANVNGYGFGGHDTALDYQGVLLVTNGRDLRLVLPHEQVILCMFMYRFEGWQAPEPAESQTCQKFSRSAFSDRGSPITQEAWDSWPKYPEARPFRQVQADLNHDGTQETIVSYDYASGAGCGCDAKPLVLLHDGALIASRRGDSLHGSAPPSIKNLGDALQDLTMTCHRKRYGAIWSVVQMDGRDFVLADYQPRPRDLRLSSYVYSWGEVPSRELYEFQDDKFVRICEQRPIATKVVAHEVVPKERQILFNYAPPE